MIPVWFWTTIAPVLPLLILGIAYQPKSLHPAKHRTGKRATRIIRSLQSEYARRSRPTGWQSPPWTVQPGELVQP